MVPGVTLQTLVAAFSLLTLVVIVLLVFYLRKRVRTEHPPVRDALADKTSLAPNKEK